MKPIAPFVKWTLFVLVLVPALAAVVAPIIVMAVLFAKEPIGDSFFSGFLGLWIAMASCAVLGAVGMTIDIWRGGVDGNQRIAWTVVVILAFTFGQALYWFTHILARPTR
jgi:hypothetical protein